MAVISGAVRQQKLYQHLGFFPFGPVVGTPEAPFQPMCLTLENFRERSHVIFQPLKPSEQATPPLKFLPGPVDIHPEVQQAFETAPVSHRSRSFVADFQAVRTALCKLSGAHHAAIILGSGTMANDAIAGQLSLLHTPGLVLVNGEFGRRLVDHARRFGLTFQTLEIDWGKAFETGQIQQTVNRIRGLDWLWAVHCETSTGVLNDLTALKQICSNRGVKLCLDCISSFGTVPLDLSNVYLASSVSGKGLGSYPGLSMVFYHHDIAPAEASLPRYLDVGLYAKYQGIPFTHSSNLIYALRAALRRVEERTDGFLALTELSVWLRKELREMGFQIIADDAHTSPAVVTLALPREVRSEPFGQRLEENGFLLSYGSEYLLQRNWIQICLMGEHTREKLTCL
ncbi:MAG: aminotransferase class V-fold PLP-dependent enzyme, partial [Candidatus Omnitrophica bacterium]|nr:aminotransferase class V-fold PLP-dependent enzyme [Candidatus Omnitrophota bacterium]